MAEAIEQGDIYFFYRTKMDVETPTSADDLQQLHMALLPDEGGNNRLFVIGRKQLPDLAKGKKPASTQRDWAMNVLSTNDAGKLRDGLAPTQYETETRGTRREPGAVPAAQGRYCLVRKDDSTQLGYRILEPQSMGKAQEELGIHGEARYVISVKNPDVHVEGFPDEKPKYPQRLQAMFAQKRWLDIEDARLLDYENAQVLLVGAAGSLGDIEVTGKPDLFGKLEASKDHWPTETLHNGRFATEAHQADATAPAGDRTKGGRRGGDEAVKAPSAAGIARALKGIELPSRKEDLVRYAKRRNANEEIIKTLERMPSRNFATMADIEKAVGEVR